ncbi:MAG: BrnA antitoxin family protein [Desulfovibrio sp.]|nr:BrnA antitoxin family protein [Desulfovibrio sp.]
MNKTETIPSVEEQLEALKNIKDEDIDFSDIPELLDWSSSVRGKFYRPIKKPVSLRIDADILEWFKKHSPQYQTAINTVLRQYVHAQQ